MLRPIESSLLLLAPVIDSHAAGILPAGVAVEKHKVRSLVMAFGGHAAVATQRFPIGAIRQMSGRPNIIEFIAADDVRDGEDGAPRCALVLGEIDCIDRLLNPADTLQADNF